MNLLQTPKFPPTSLLPFQKIYAAKSSKSKSRSAPDYFTNEPHPQPHPERFQQTEAILNIKKNTSTFQTSRRDLHSPPSASLTTFAQEGPFREDVTALAIYLKRVVAEERDVEKAVSLVKWLVWLVEDDRANGGANDRASIGASSTVGTGKESQEGVPGTQCAISWDEALKCLKDGVLEGLEERGMPAVDFLD
jgi:DNA repair protein REV1